MHDASALLRRILVLNEQLEYEMRRTMNVNETDFRAMSHLLRTGGMSSSELAAALRITPAAVTTVVDRLIAAGHAKRSPHPSDRRRSMVTAVPDSARQTMGMLMPMITQTDDLVRAMPPAQQSAVVEYLAGVATTMERWAQTLGTDRETPAATGRD